MPVSVRLDAHTEAMLRRLARVRRASRSEVIRLAIETLAGRSASSRDGTLYERMKPSIGSWDSGGRNLSRDTGRRFRELLHRRRERERRSR